MRWPVGDRRRGVAALALAAVLAVAVAVGWSVFVGPARLVVHAYDVASPRWPRGRAPLRIAVLSDLHVGAPHMGLDRVREVVARTNAEHPDLIVLLGDFVIHGVVGGRFVPPEPTADVLASLRGRYPIVSVLGNHDWWYDGPRVRAALERVGIRVLDNEAMALGEGADRFWLAGLGDLWTCRVDIAGTLSAVPVAEPVIVLEHNPDVFPQVPARVALTLAGHTHGGQVALPLLGRPIVPSRYGQRYAAGVVVEDSRLLVVSPGLGTSILPVRFRVPPEISLVTLSGR
jgi:uncharacterized protein